LNTYTSNPLEKYADTGKAWDKLNVRIENDGMLMNEKPVIRINRTSYFIRAAAVVLLILAVGIPSVYYSVNEFGNKDSMVEQKSKNGILTVDLPDGSRVFLNEGSSLEYSKNYENSRDVNLSGEGFFDVMSNPQKPFRVNSGKVVVTVLGTSFNVKEKNSKTVEVFVESGQVRLDLKKKAESIILNAGDIVEANGQLKSHELLDANYLSWKTKEFKFVDESVENIIYILEAAYHVDVDTNATGIADKRLTTSYSGQSIEAILSTICTALELSYEKDGKVYILHSN
jgi:ferric-dicitrate binding protein FerR (iron transport regulator)